MQSKFAYLSFPFVSGSILASMFSDTESMMITTTFDIDGFAYSFFFLFTCQRYAILGMLCCHIF